MSSWDFKPLTENCRNCGAPFEPVCSFCGTVHDGKTYKQRNLPPPAPLTEEQYNWYMSAQIGIQFKQPLHPFILDIIQA